MVRFSYYRRDGGEQWVLCGELSGAWVEDVRSVWRRIREQSHGRDVRIDLNAVTFIDEAGEALLAEMQHAVAEFHATAAERQQMPANHKTEDPGTVRRQFEDLNGGRS